MLFSVPISYTVLCNRRVYVKNTTFMSLFSEQLEIQPVHSEGDQPWDFFGGNDAKAETPVLWPPHAKSWLIGNDSDAGRDWGQEEKGASEDEMAGWHHWLDGRESEWTPGVGDGQGGLVCCNSWGLKESDTTEQLIWSDRYYIHLGSSWISWTNQFCEILNSNWETNCLVPKSKVCK